MRHSNKLLPRSARWHVLMRVKEGRVSCCIQGLPIGVYKRHIRLRCKGHVLQRIRVLLLLLLLLLLMLRGLMREPACWRVRCKLGCCRLAKPSVAQRKLLLQIVWMLKVGRKVWVLVKRRCWCQGTWGSHRVWLGVRVVLERLGNRKAGWLYK